MEANLLPMLPSFYVLVSVFPAWKALNLVHRLSPILLPWTYVLCIICILFVLYERHGRNVVVNVYWFRQSGLLYTGGEDRSVTAWDTKTGKIAYQIEDAHSTRVKGVVILSKSNGTSGDDDPYLVTSASSDGVIRVWDVRMAMKEKPIPLAEVNTKSRLTCLAGTSLKCEYWLFDFFLELSFSVAFPS